MLDLLLIEWVTEMKPDSNSVEDRAQVSPNRHPVDGALVGAGSLSPRFSYFGTWRQRQRVRVGYISTLNHMFSKIKEPVLTVDQRFISLNPFEPLSKDPKKFKNWIQELNLNRCFHKNQECF
jgi:hypothetical protein